MQFVELLMANCRLGFSNDHDGLENAGADGTAKFNGTGDVWCGKFQSPIANKRPIRVS
jgi:hypothetical protein